MDFFFTLVMKLEEVTMSVKLNFNKDGRFKIVQLTDLHYTNDDEADHKTVKLMRDILDAEKPDFVISTGDMVYGENNLKYLPKVFAPLEEGDFCWTFTFGNHDSEWGHSKEELLAAAGKMRGCVAYHDVNSVDGVGNHIIEIQDKNQKTKWVISAIDSGDYNKWDFVGGYAFVTGNQINWYKNIIKELEKENENFSVINFQHIALPEFEDVFKYEKCYGIKREGCGAPRLNSGLFYAMLEAGHTKGVFVGHDHANDYYGKLFGITLGYGRAGGYGTYGAPDHLKGARVFILDENDTENFTTYMRLENGEVITEPWGYSPLWRRDDG